MYVWSINYQLTNAKRELVKQHADLSPHIHLSW